MENKSRDWEQVHVIEIFLHSSEDTNKKLKVNSFTHGIQDGECRYIWDRCSRLSVSYSQAGL